jgi:hypothetical protein
MSDLGKEEEFQVKSRALNDEIRRIKINIRETQEKQKEIDRVN